jgi:CHAT domain-containing protein
VTTPAGSLALLIRQENGSAVAESLWADSLTSADLKPFLTPATGEPVSAHLAGKVGDLLRLLGDRLISPVAQRLAALKAEGVVLVPCGVLGLLPLHACDCLIAGRPAALFDQLDVSYAPSARVLLAARESLERAVPGSPTLAGVANPLPNPVDLRFAQMELEQAASFFDPGDRKPLYESSATLKGVEEISSHARYLHFACHGHFEPREPLDSALDLAGGDRLTLRQILDSASFQDVRLVVLSACETACIEHERLPDEVLGLPAGLLSAGAPGVVGTLWPVNDISTALLMRKFYELHLAGDRERNMKPMPPARALRLAQVWLRDVTSGELFDFFTAHRGPQSVLTHPKSSKVAAAGAAMFGLDEPDHRPFAETPYHWAPFVYVGA